MFNILLTINLPKNLPVNFFLKSANIGQNYGHESVAPLFWPTLYITLTFFSVLSPSHFISAVL